MNWISCEDRLPTEEKYYLVWIPEWEGYGNAAGPDLAFFEDGEWAGLNAFPFVEDGAPISHWCEIEPPQNELQKQEQKRTTEPPPEGGR